MRRLQRGYLWSIRRKRSRGGICSSCPVGDRGMQDTNGQNGEESGARAPASGHQPLAIDSPAFNPCHFAILRHLNPVKSEASLRVPSRHARCRSHRRGGYGPVLAATAAARIYLGTAAQYRFKVVNMLWCSATSIPRFSMGQLLACAAALRQSRPARREMNQFAHGNRD